MRYTTIFQIINLFTNEKVSNIISSMKRLYLCVGLLPFLAFYSLSAESNKKYSANHIFHAGERLTYSISWSKVLEAGVAVMEIKEEISAEGRRTYHATSTSKTVGIVRTFYHVSDVVKSVIDADGFYSLSYELNQRHGKRKRHRMTRFDHENGTVSMTSDGKEETYHIPFRVQDPLSALYYLRTKESLDTGTSVMVDVFDKGKTWSVEIKILGREKVRTPVGEFNAIKVVTYPKYEGVFQHKGEIFIWLTDDVRKIPVVMKSSVSIGSIVATLIEITPKQGE